MWRINSACANCLHEASIHTHDRDQNNDTKIIDEDHNNVQEMKHSDRPLLRSTDTKH